MQDKQIDGIIGFYGTTKKAPFSHVELRKKRLHTKRLFLAGWNGKQEELI